MFNVGDVITSKHRGDALLVEAILDGDKLYVTDLRFNLPMIIEFEELKNFKVHVTLENL